MKLLTLSDLKHFWTNAVQKIPIKISDLQDDVALGTHVADTDIHVTTADKTKWNNGVSQAYVLRYSSSSVTDNSTIAYSTLDNTDNIKSGDKVIDVDGKIFAVVSVDTANSTVTVGSALIDLALDGNVVHTSGNETVGGSKTFSNNLLIYNSDNSVDAPRLNIKTSKYVKGDTTNTDIMRINFLDTSNNSVASIYANKNTSGTQYLSFQVYTTDSNNANITSTINYYISKNGDKYFLPYEDNQISLGGTVRRWKSVYATNYYYGNDNVEFSTKFVTTDTNQTISGTKSFSVSPYIYNADSTANTPNLYLRSSKIEISSQGNTSGDQNLTYLDKNSTTYAYIKGAIQSTGSAVKIRAITKDSSDNSVINELQILAYTNGNKAVFPSYSNEIDLGTSGYKWKDVQTNLINGLTPSSLSMPCDRGDRIDISSYITNLGNGDNNVYTAPANGYISLHFTSINSALCYSQTSGGLTNYAQTFVRYSGDGQLYAFFPIRKDDNFVVQVYTSSTAVVQNAYFCPCLGNV